jgi:hypothetical protein
VTEERPHHLVSEPNPEMKCQLRVSQNSEQTIDLPLAYDLSDKTIAHPRRSTVWLDSSLRRSARRACTP